MELKFHDVDLDDAVIAAGANVTPSINLVAQGVTEITRVGRKFTIKKIGWKFKVTLPVLATSNASSGDVVRVIMYIDKQCNGATAASTDVLETADFQSFNNLANKGRFRTLMDRTYDLNANGGAGDGTSNDLNAYTVSDSFYKDCTVPIGYDNPAATITGIKSKNIGVILLSENGLASFESKIRLRFSDM